ncbi:MAG: RES family NAD+ phosphorylase [Lachnospiraceae bacterium]|nr:RES family NAD+ phosphorylase [Lachnospiraceae bacterium]
MEIGWTDKDVFDFVNQMGESFQYIIAICFLIGDEEKATLEMWEDFKKEIKYHSHFFPKSKILDVIQGLSNCAVYELEKGTRLYRARKADNDTVFTINELKVLLEELNNQFPGMHLSMQDFSSYAKVNALILSLLKDKQKYNEVQKKLEQIWKKNKKFWGYNKKESDAPPFDKTPAGRANFKNIRFLYAADGIDTAILEVGAKTQQSVSIAEIKIRRKIRLFDFCYDIGKFSNEHYSDSISLRTLSKEFSQPNFGDETEYFPTQYLCEFIRDLGFDGIRFGSSLNPKGKNIVIFNTVGDDKAYRIVNSKVYVVKAIDIDYEQILPYKLQQDDNVL